MIPNRADSNSISITDVCIVIVSTKDNLGPQLTANENMLGNKKTEHVAKDGVGMQSQMVWRLYYFYKTPTTKSSFSQISEETEYNAESEKFQTEFKINLE